MENELVGYALAALVVLGFAFFIYKKVSGKKKSTGTGVGGGGGIGPGGGGNVNEN